MEQHVACCISRQRRGIALLAVLGLIMVVVLTLTMLARHSGVLQLEREDYGARQIMRDVLRDLTTDDGLLVHWLRNESEQIVMAPGIASPSVVIAMADVNIDGRQLVVSIGAWDEHGMIGPQGFRESALLRGALPQPIEYALRDRLSQPSGAFGLDDLTGPPGERARGGVRVFPLIRNNSRDNAEWSAVSEQEAAERAIGAFFSTHNADPTTINLSTAPMGVVEAAMRYLGRGDAEIVRKARDNGRKPGAGSQRNAGNDSERVRLVNVSTCWAFRIDLAYAATHTSWWCVYVKTRPHDSREERWHLSQMLEIEEF